MNYKKRVKTYTRKDIEEIIESKLTGKQLTQKIITDTFFESLRELLI